jgi:hypothetical protein
VPTTYAGLLIWKPTYVSPVIRQEMTFRILLWRRFNTISIISIQILLFIESNQLKTVEGLIFPNNNIFTHVDFKANRCIDELKVDGKYSAEEVSEMVMKKCSCNSSSCDPVDVLKEKHELETTKLKEKIETLEESREENLGKFLRIMLVFNVFVVGYLVLGGGGDC